MDKTRFKHEDWARVRFGAGTPWRRCWCVISPPDEKDIKQHQKHMKKRSAYERAKALKGDIKFYDTMKTKKAIPIATINDAYSAYAIYPQSKPLIDQSTLVKVEGNITIHSSPETTTEGFVFVMPETHPAVTGFEIMLRWLFPLYDVFALYGRPTRLIAETTDTRSLMFALPSERRYGYLEILDVAGLIHENGSQMWNEQEWRRRLKELTATRVSRMHSGDARPRSRASSMSRRHRNSLPNRANTLRFEDGASIRSNPSLRHEPAPSPPPHKSGSVPISETPFRPPSVNRTNSHQRSVSEALPYSNPRYQKSQRSIREHEYAPSRLSRETQRDAPMDGPPPMPPAHGVPMHGGMDEQNMQSYPSEIGSHERSSSESERRYRHKTDLEAQDVHQDVRPAPPPFAVAAPPAFAHEPGVKPQKRPMASPEMRRANSRLSITTLSQLADAKQRTNSDTSTAGAAAAGASAAWRTRSNASNVNGAPMEYNGYRSAGQSPHRGNHGEDQGQRGVNEDYRYKGTPADPYLPREGMVLAKASHTNGTHPDANLPNSIIQDGRDNSSKLDNINKVHDIQELHEADGPNGTTYPSNVDNRSHVGYYENPVSRDDVVDPDHPQHPNEAFLVHNAGPDAPSHSKGQDGVHSSSIFLPTQSPFQKTAPTSHDMQQSDTNLYLNHHMNNENISQISLQQTSYHDNPKPSTSPPMNLQEEHRPEAHRQHSIPRKAVPTRSISQPQPKPEPQPQMSEAEERSSLDSLKAHVIDEAALDQVLAHNASRATTMDSRVDPTKDADESIYDDDVSSKSPSYASTRPSVETKRSRKSIDPPRRGILKTVGQAEPEQIEVVVGDAHYRPNAPKAEIDTSIPAVDFGPTQAMRPTTGDGVKQRATTLGLGKREKVPDGRPQTARQESGHFLTDKTGELKIGGDSTKHANPKAPQPTQPARYRNVSAQAMSDADRRRSQIWSGPPPSVDKRQSLTPEEYAQQRYLASQQPQYAPPKPRNISNTAQISRHSSGDFTPQHSRQSSASPRISRNSSAEQVPLNHSRQGSYSRPQSAMAGRPSTPSPRSTIMGRATTPSPRLSGYNQDQPARVITSPLINLSNSPRTPDYGPGLIHHIGAREQEKREIKQAINNRAVQDAQERQLQQQHMRQSSYGSQMQMQMPGQWPSTPTYVQQQDGRYTQIQPQGQPLYPMQQHPMQQHPQMYPQQQSPIVYQQQMTPPGGQFQQIQQGFDQVYGQPQYGPPQHGQSQSFLPQGQDAQTYFQQQPWIIGGPNGPSHSGPHQQAFPHAQTPQQQQQQQPQLVQQQQPQQRLLRADTAPTTIKAERRSSWFSKLSDQLPGGKSK